MPYKLRKAPKRELYWVVNKETGKKFSKDPLPKETAKKQMKALYAQEGGYELRGGIRIPTRVLEGLQTFLNGWGGRILANIVGVGAMSSTIPSLMGFHPEPAPFFDTQTQQAIAFLASGVGLPATANALLSLFRRKLDNLVRDRRIDERQRDDALRQAQGQMPDALRDALRQAQTRLTIRDPTTGTQKSLIPPQSYRKIAIPANFTDLLTTEDIKDGEDIIVISDGLPLEDTPISTINTGKRNSILGWLGKQQREVGDVYKTLDNKKIENLVLYSGVADVPKSPSSVVVEGAQPGAGTGMGRFRGRRFNEETFFDEL